MLKYSLAKNHAGIVLSGDYESLRGLHDVIHEVNERSPLIKDKESSLLGLAYDIRKAYERQREIIQPPEHYPEIGPRYGVKILWPVILWQSRMLRESMAFIDTSKRMQAQAYALESVIEAALPDAFGGDIGAEVLVEWEKIDARHPYSGEALESRGAVFSAWSKSERKKGITGLIASLSSMYPFLYTQWVKRGVQGLISPDEYDVYIGAEWVDPKW